MIEDLQLSYLLSCLEWAADSQVLFAHIRGWDKTVSRGGRLGGEGLYRLLEMGKGKGDFSR